jgi:predicted DNA-binding antitoxin AbrB/MazE fold protein
MERPLLDRQWLCAITNLDAKTVEEAIEMKTRTLVRAIHHEGVLKLLDEVTLPEGAQVSVIVFDKAIDEAQSPETVGFYPTRFVPAERLDRLTGVVAVGGDALADSEALYD